jgi:hypothetical protein
MSTDFILKRYRRSGPDKFLTLRSFDVLDSNIIFNALQKSNEFNLYFNDLGVIEITDKEKNTLKLFINNLTNQTESNITNSNLITINNKENKYIFSKPFGKYILYLKDKDNVSLRYNPVPRPEYSNYVNNSNIKTATDYIIETCFETNLEEPFCKCIWRPNTSSDYDIRDRQFCMNDLLGGTNIRSIIETKTPKDSYTNVAKFCDCSNPSCLDEHPYKKKLRQIIGECPSNLITTICNTSFDAGNKLQTGDVSVQQKCGAEVAKLVQPEQEEEKKEEEKKEEEKKEEEKKEEEKKEEEKKETSKIDKEPNTSLKNIIYVCIVIIIFLIILYFIKK